MLRRKPSHRALRKSRVHRMQAIDRRLENLRGRQPPRGRLTGAAADCRPCANKHKTRLLLAPLASRVASQFEPPFAHAARKTQNLPSRGDVASLLTAQPFAKSARKEPVIHLRARAHRSSDRSRSAALHHQGSPLMNHTWIAGQFHAAKEMMRRHRSMTGLEKVHIIRSLHETNMRDRMDEVLRRPHNTCRCGGAQNCFECSNCSKILSALPMGTPPC